MEKKKEEQKITINTGKENINESFLFSGANISLTFLFDFWFFIFFIVRKVPFPSFAQLIFAQRLPASAPLQ